MSQYSISQKSTKQALLDSLKVVLIDPSGFTLPYDHCLCAGLAQRGCQVFLVTSQSPYVFWNHTASYERLNHFFRFTNRIYKTPSGLGRKYVKGIEYLYDMERLIHQLHKLAPDVIHFQWLPLPLVDSLFLPRLRKIAPLILTVHDTQPFQGSPVSRVQLLGWRKTLYLFDHLIVHTYFSQHELITSTGIPQVNISVIPHGFFNYYKDIRSPNINTLKASDSKKIVLFFGVIKPYKGLDLLIQAFSRLPDKLRKEAELLVVGYPKIPVEPLKELAKRLGISDNIVWDLRFVPEEEVATVFEQAFVVVLPYRRIDQSGVLMTALAFGKPVIATKVGGFPEIIKDGVHGYLVNPGNVDELAQVMEMILSQPATAWRMGKAVEELAKGELSFDTIANKTVQVYRRLINR
jgi:glycosyltransferase involved in cell wall biosynthesis